MKLKPFRYVVLGTGGRAMLFCQLLVGFNCAHAAKPVEPAASLAEQLTQRAVDAGLQGDLQSRTTLLDDAMRVDPDYAPARWEAGQVSIDGEWLPLNEAQARAAADPRLERYLAARQASRDDPSGHLQLARWCRRNQLNDEARYHWLRVLSASPYSKEALQALDSTWHRGRLVSDEVATELQQNERAQLKANREWRLRIAKWERALAEGSAAAAIEELNSLVDVSAIPEFEKLAAGQAPATSTVAGHRQRLSLAFITAIDQKPDFAATESLFRFALLAPDESLRNAATEALVDRPQHEFMPLLLSGLASPIESHFSLATGPGGYVSYTHEFFTEGPTADQVYERARSAHFNVLPESARSPRDNGRRASWIANASWQSKRNASQRMRHFQREAQVVEQQVKAENARRLNLNERIIGILRQVVGEDLGDDPLAWWDYWRDYNEYERPPYRPTDYSRHEYCERQVIERPRMSCFVAGTPVWTKTGLAPIESLTPGELVLSQDLSTGEYRFRPVLVTTRRDPSPTLTVTAGGESIQTTLGHPFWLPTVGWRMAKELETGDRLLAIKNPVQVEKISQASDQVAFNLVVEGPGNYFVGSEGLLVHDNTPRRPELEQLGER